jgi:hypothetical protein
MLHPSPDSSFNDNWGESKTVLKTIVEKSQYISSTMVLSSLWGVPVSPAEFEKTNLPELNIKPRENAEIISSGSTEPQILIAAPAKLWLQPRRRINFVRNLDKYLF